MRPFTCAIVVALAIVLPLEAQSLAGTWLGEDPNGGSIGLSLAVDGTRVTGSFILIQGGQSLPVPIQDGTLTKGALTFSVTIGARRADFSGEHSGDRLTLQTSSPNAQVRLTLSRVQALPASTLSPLAATVPASAPAGWRAHNRAATLVEETGRQVVKVDGRLGDGVIWRDGTRLVDGTIELELRGSNLPGQSFVGVAFRGLDDSTYDAVYFRPFNFKAAEPGRLRAVQYVSHPGHPWDRLRAEHPGLYEAAISPVPDPDGWFRARVVVEGRTVQLFVNDASTPTLTVTTLSESRGSLVGLWVGNASRGDFANLRVTTK